VSSKELSVLFFFSFLVGDNISLFSTSIRNPFSKSESSSDFLFLKECKSLGELSFKINKNVIDLLSDIITIGFILREVSSKLSKLSNSILLEDVAVHLKFISNILSANLGKAWLSSEVTAQVLLKMSNNFNSITVVLEGFNEKSVSITSVFRKLFSSSFNFLKSVFSPLLPSFNIKDLFFNIFNVSLSSLPVVLVNI